MARIIIQRQRSIVPACDVNLDLHERIVKETSDIDGVGAYKVGFELALAYGLPRVVEVTRRHTNKPIIYDHQKGGTDIPETGKNFARVVKESGVNAVILFPMSGPDAEHAWICEARNAGLDVIVGGLMTHTRYLRSEGGYLVRRAVMQMYTNALKLGVRNFVVPGNKPNEVERIKRALLSEGVESENLDFYAPGFVAQGGKISEAAKVAGDRWHAIVGRGIYEAKDVRKAALEHVSNLS